MLKSIFGESGAPLFGRFTLLEVGQLEEKDAATLYLRSALGADETEFREVYRLVGGHPFYLLVMAEARLEKESVDDRYKRLLTEVTGGLYMYVNYILTEDLGSNIGETHYVRILRILAQGEKRISEIAHQSSLTMTSLPRYLTKLIEFDLVEKDNGTYKLNDHIIADYFRFNFQEDFVLDTSSESQSAM